MIVSDTESPAERGASPSGDGVDIAPSFALAAALVAVPLILVGWLFFAIVPGPWWLGVLLGLLVAVVLVWLRLRSAATGVLSKLGGGLLQTDGSVRLENLVRGLSLAGGVEEPEVVILSDPARNAMAVRGPIGSQNHLVITQGLLQALEVVELEGVVAELLTRLKNGDAEAATVGAALFGQPILDGPLSSVLSPVASFGLGRLLNDDRDLEADRQAVSLTRYPPGLYGALQLIGQGDVVPKSYSKGLAHLWLIDPAGGADDSGAARAPLDLRIDVLAEL